MRTLQQSGNHLQSQTLGQRPAALPASGYKQNVNQAPEGMVRPLRILLAEDNRVNQLLAVRLLEKRGHTVVAVQNGREAVDAIERESFDLALLDVQMPVMDGLQAAALIRQIERDMGWGHLPLIAMTAYAMKGDEERCLAAGMDAYVPKPIKFQRLLEVIRELKPSPAPSTTHSTATLSTGP